MTDFGKNYQFWCEGLPLVGTQPLDSNTREQIIALARRDLKIVSRITIAIMILVALILWIGVKINAGQWDHKGDVAGVVVILMGLSPIWLPILLLIGSFRILSWRRWKITLSRNHLRVFEEIRATSNTDDRGRETATTGGDWARIELLPEHDRIFRINGEILKKPKPTKLAQTAAIQSSHFYASLPDWAIDPKTLHYGIQKQRHMTDGEVIEIRRRSNSMFLSDAVSLTIFGSIGVYQLIQWMDTGARFLHLATFRLLVAAFALLVGLACAIDIFRTWKLRRALDNKMLVHIQFRTDVPEIVDEIGAGIYEAEFIPNTRFEWTINGQPAKWRTTRF